MAFRGPSAHHRLPAVRLIVLLAALAGLFAMHGLSDHGATHPGGQTIAHGWPSLDSGFGHHVGPALAATASAAEQAALRMAAAPERAEFVLPSGDAGSSGGMGLVGLCLAIVGLIGLVSLALDRRRRRPRWLVTRVGRGRLSVSRGLQIRTADPPARYLLQVHRC